MGKEHKYKTNVEWTGNKGTGTSNYREFERSHTISVEKKVSILCSSDPAFRGDSSKYNPEELLVSSISSCHMLWYLHLCSEAKVVVLEYTDFATGTMVENANGSGQFSEVVLKPLVKVKDASMIDEAQALHKKANEFCFIANSVNFDVRHQSTCVEFEG